MARNYPSSLRRKIKQKTKQKIQQSLLSKQYIDDKEDTYFLYNDLTNKFDSISKSNYKSLLASGNFNASKKFVKTHSRVIAEQILYFVDCLMGRVLTYIKGSGVEQETYIKLFFQLEECLRNNVRIPSCVGILMARA